MELGQYSDLLHGYTELRLQRNTIRRLSVVNGDVSDNTSSTRGGVSARVWQGGVWGFASATDDTRDGIARVVGTATDNARYLAGRVDKGMGALPGRSASSTDMFRAGAARWSGVEVIDRVQELDSWIAATFPQLSSRVLRLSSLDMEKHLLTSEGSASSSLVPRANLHVRLAISEHGEPVVLGDVHGGYGHVEDSLADIDAIKAAIERQVVHLERKAHAVYASAGWRTVVLDADLAGILAHEAIGHTTEADLVLGGSVAGDRLGQQVASPLVSLTDFAHTAFGERCPVPVHLDDEGQPSEDVPIIVDGVLKGFMHSKETALRMGQAPTGNARAFQFSDEPLVRMRNTTILPGESKLEDMIASVDDGYYLMRSSNGQADATSEFMFGVVLGYEIKNGQLGRAIRDTTISGVAFDVLQTVSMVSDDLVWQSSGMCGKKQPIPVGMGGPAIKCIVHVGGE